MALMRRDWAILTRSPRLWQAHGHAPCMGQAGYLSMLLMGVLMALAYVVLKASRHLGLRRLGITAGAADTFGVALLAAVCLGTLVPGAVNRAAAAVRARARGEPPPATIDWRVTP
ncbi:MAG: hypothetical protein Q8P31_01600 [Bacillota bacterium]|nr:hypothetical protein [Bacillota bacterium]